MFAAGYRLLAPPGQAGLGIHAYSCFRLMFTHWDEIGKACESSSDPRAAAAAADLRILRYRVLFRAMLQHQQSRGAASPPSGDEPMSHDTVIDLLVSLCGTREHAQAVAAQHLKRSSVDLAENDFIAFVSGVFPALGLSSYGHIKHLLRPQPRPVVLSRSTDSGGECGVAVGSASRKRRVDEDAVEIEAGVGNESCLSVRAGTVVQGHLRETVDWRGVLVDRETKAYADANAIIARTKAMMMNTYSEGDAVFDGDWPHALAQMVGHKTAKSCARVMKRLSKEAKRIVQLQPMVVRAPSPTKVFGDIHGQLRDLLLLFREHGFPSNKGGDIESTTYVFNGDFVDRGSHQVEVTCLMFALKVAFPSKVFLIRGNHEFPEQNEHMGKAGFKAACDDMFDVDCADGGSDDAAEDNDDRDDGGLGSSVYRTVHACFEWLPFACVVADRSVVNCFCFGCVLV
jgi:hypothetical protein